jgi:hypothetical protein
MTGRGVKSAKLSFQITSTPDGAATAGGGDPGMVVVGSISGCPSAAPVADDMGIINNGRHAANEWILKQVAEKQEEKRQQVYKFNRTSIIIIF